MIMVKRGSSYSSTLMDAEEVIASQKLNVNGSDSLHGQQHEAALRFD